ncbi:PAS domain S-box-containing protein/diguanylate cyclase (GGDEF) domain-containing protein [Devosia enhydra]|uniref:diguanylate cyclase n=1 Tax=Devosia enhydra TaxID=665118 RepID=A0A1K2I256_9HYPH|nr:diguanylate cyclase [Devosia enhydra]SFZ86474.1 PAS domain S-box-containing protein/diguanylate cyclase (GGDEF) domain-containing protein [Devosia enhydra]
MNALWYGLLANLAVVAIFVMAWTHLRDYLNFLKPRAEALAFGTHMGIAAIFAMSVPVELAPGVIFDLRPTIASLASFFGGPMAALVFGVIAASYRLWLGGAGAISGVIGLLVPLGVGLLGHFLLRNRETKVWHIAVLAATTVTTTLIGITALASPFRQAALTAIALPRGLILIVATIISGLALLQDKRRRAAEQQNRMYRTIIETLPDSLNVKDIDGHFLAANPASAKMLGVASPDVLIGRSFRDFYPPETADDIAASERAALLSDRPAVIDHDVVTADGVTRRLATLKVPLRDAAGSLIGIITHNRDVSDRHGLELKLEQSRQQLEFALTHMSDGVAMFDAEGRLSYCNEQYRKAFPLTGHLRVPGTPIRTILRAVIEKDEQTIPGDPANWIEAIAGQLFANAEEEVHMTDGRWLRISTRPTDSGTAMVVVTDITQFKLTETDLMRVNDRLRREASTDALTGLMNRRAMDEALAAEIALSIRNDQPISVILLDIDLFKPFNDRYGHQAGDECLKTISQCFRDVFRRSGDIVARYGGEEFLAILPDTDEDGAYHLANAFRARLNGVALPHQDSPRGIVTASLGIATYGRGDELRRASDLVARADEALYGAKRAGRDRINGWHRRMGERRRGGHVADIDA